MIGSNASKTKAATLDSGLAEEWGRAARERLPLLAGLLLLALGIFLGSLFIAGGIRDRWRE